MFVATMAMDSTDHGLVSYVQFARTWLELYMLL